MHQPYHVHPVTWSAYAIASASSTNRVPSVLGRADASTGCHGAFDTADAPKGYQGALPISDAPTGCQEHFISLVHPLEAKVYLTQILSPQGARMHFLSGALTRCQCAFDTANARID